MFCKFWRESVKKAAHPAAPTNTAWRIFMEHRVTTDAKLQLAKRRKYGDLPQRELRAKAKNRRPVTEIVSRTV